MVAFLRIFLGKDAMSSLIVMQFVILVVTLLVTLFFALPARLFFIALTISFFITLAVLLFFTLTVSLLSQLSIRSDNRSQKEADHHVSHLIEMFFILQFTTSRNIN